MLNTLPNEAAQEYGLADERTSTEISKLDKLNELLQPHDRINDKHSEMLEKVSTEVVELLKEPIKKGLKNVEKYAGTPRGDTLQREYDKSLASLEFLNKFCEQLSDPKYSPEVSLEVFDDQNGGIKIKVKPYEKGKNIGFISDEPVQSAEITIRAADLEKDDLYTPLKLGFSFFSEGENVGSLRVEVHSDRDSVQVDATVGGPDFEMGHMNVKTLNESGDMRNNFKILLNNFLINLVENRVATTCADKVHFENTKRNNGHGSDVLKSNYERAKEFVGMRDLEGQRNLNEINLAEAAEIVVPSLFMKIENTIDKDAIGIIVDTIRISESPKETVYINALNENVVLINWLLGIPQVDLTPERAAKLVPYLRDLSEFLTDFENIPPWNENTDNKLFEKEYEAAEGIARAKYSNTTIETNKDYLRLFSIKHALTGMVQI